MSGEYRRKMAELPLVGVSNSDRGEIVRALQKESGMDAELSTDERVVVYEVFGDG